MHCAARLFDAAKVRDRREALPSSEQLRTVIDALPEDQVPGLHLSRERKTHHEAELRRLEVLRLRGELLKADDVKKLLLRPAARSETLCLRYRISWLFTYVVDTGHASRRLGVFSGSSRGSSPSCTSPAGMTCRFFESPRGCCWDC